MCSVPSMHRRRPLSLACRAAVSRVVGEACGLTAPALAGGDTAPRLLGPPPEPERQVSSPQDSLSTAVSNPCPVFQLHEQASHICEPLPRGDLQRLRPPQWDSAALRRRPLCERLGECAVLGGGGAGGGSAFLCLAPPASARRGAGGGSEFLCLAPPGSARRGAGGERHPVSPVLARQAGHLNLVRQQQAVCHSVSVPLTKGFGTPECCRRDSALGSVTRMN